MLHLHLYFVALRLFCQKQIIILGLAAKQKERYQAALDDYYSFMEEFPKSLYAKEVNNIFQKTNKFLKAGIADSGINNQ